MYFTSDPLAFMNERFISGIGRSAERGRASLLRRTLRSPTALDFRAEFFRIIQHCFKELLRPTRIKCRFWRSTPHGYIPFGGHAAAAASVRDVRQLRKAA
jgi:hypothetical protein